MRRFSAVLTLTLTLGVFITGCDNGPTRPEVQSESAPTASTQSPSASHRGPHARPENFVAPLSGDEVVPPVDTDARGLAKFTLNKAGDELHFKLNVANIEDVIGAHIHRAPAGENGPIVVFLFGNPLTDPVTVNGTLAEGSITASDVLAPIGVDFGALVEAIRVGNTYVQVHTEANPSGEIRGQIDGVGPPSNPGIQGVDAVRNTTEEYEDVGEAKADGYTKFSVFVPNMGFHDLHESVINEDGTSNLDRHLNRTKPEVLVYGDTQEGNSGQVAPSNEDFRAVEYVIAKRTAKLNLLNMRLHSSTTLTPTTGTCIPARTNFRCPHPGPSTGSALMKADLASS